jgi:zinc transport system permease protein
MISFIVDFFSYSFTVNALVASLLISIAAGMVGAYIVARRLVFLSGGITHASFGGVGIAFYLGVNPILGAAVFAVLSAFGVELLTGRLKVREDSSIGILWSLGMAVGIFFVFLTPGYAPNLMSFMFGSILTISKTDIWMLFTLTMVMAIFFIVFFRAILYLSFDASFARTQGVPVELFSYILMGFMALTIVLSIRLVGIILLLSLLTIPPSIVNTFTKRFSNIILWSMLVAFVGCLGGLVVSYTLNVPSGATIILILMVMFVFAKAYRYISVNFKKTIAN